MPSCGQLTNAHTGQGVGVVKASGSASVSACMIMLEGDTQCLPSPRVVFEPWVGWCVCAWEKDLGFTFLVKRGILKDLGVTSAASVFIFLSSLPRVMEPLQSIS